MSAIRRFTRCIVVAIALLAMGPLGVHAQIPPLAPGGVEVTPDGTALTVTQYTFSNLVSFNVLNDSPITRTFSLACSATTGLTCEEVDPTSVTLLGWRRTSLASTPSWSSVWPSCGRSYKRSCARTWVGCGSISSIGCSDSGRRRCSPWPAWRSPCSSAEPVGAALSFRYCRLFLSSVCPATVWCSSAGIRMYANPLDIDYQYDFEQLIQDILLPHSARSGSLVLG
jgi:hypothetical protein